MMDKDQRTKEQIAYVINWSQKNSFWSGNIQSMSTLREQYDKLIVQIKNEQQNDQRKVEQQQERHIGPVPEWFKNRNKEQRDTSLSPEEAAYFEAERQKVLAMLGKRDTQQSSQFRPTKSVVNWLLTKKQIRQQRLALCIKQLQTSEACKTCELKEAYENEGKGIWNTVQCKESGCEVFSKLLGIGEALENLSRQRRRRKWQAH